MNCLWLQTVLKTLLKTAGNYIFVWAPIIYLAHRGALGKIINLKYLCRPLPTASGFLDVRLSEKNLYPRLESIQDWLQWIKVAVEAHTAGFKAKTRHQEPCLNFSLSFKNAWCYIKSLHNLLKHFVGKDGTFTCENESCSVVSYSLWPHGLYSHGIL